MNTYNYDDFVNLHSFLLNIIKRYLVEVKRIEDDSCFLNDYLNSSTIILENERISFAVKKHILDIGDVVEINFDRLEDLDEWLKLMSSSEKHKKLYDKEERRKKYLELRKEFKNEDKNN